MSTRKERERLEEEAKQQLALEEQEKHDKFEEMAMELEISRQIALDESENGMKWKTSKASLFSLQFRLLCDLCDWRLKNHIIEDEPDHFHPNNNNITQSSSSSSSSKGKGGGKELTKQASLMIPVRSEEIKERLKTIELVKKIVKVSHRIEEIIQEWDSKDLCYSDSDQLDKECDILLKKFPELAKAEIPDAVMQIPDIEKNLDPPLAFQSNYLEGEIWDIVQVCDTINTIYETILLETTTGGNEMKVILNESGLSEYILTYFHKIMIRPGIGNQLQNFLGGFQKHWNISTTRRTRMVTFGILTGLIEKDFDMDSLGWSYAMAKFVFEFILQICPIKEFFHQMKKHDGQPVIDMSLPHVQRKNKDGSKFTLLNLITELFQDWMGKRAMKKFLTIIEEETYEKNYEEFGIKVNIDKLLYTVIIQWLSLFSSEKFLNEHFSVRKESTIEKIKKRLQEVENRKQKLEAEFSLDPSTANSRVKSFQAKKNYVYHCVKRFLPNRKTKSVPTTPTNRGGPTTYVALASPLRSPKQPRSARNIVFTSKEKKKEKQPKFEEILKGLEGIIKLRHLEEQQAKEKKEEEEKERIAIEKRMEKARLNRNKRDTLFTNNKKKKEKEDNDNDINIKWGFMKKITNKGKDSMETSFEEARATHYYGKIFKSICVSSKSPGTKDCVIRLAPNDTLGSVRESLSLKHNITAPKTVIELNGKELLDDTKTVTGSGIVNNCCINFYSEKAYKAMKLEKIKVKTKFSMKDYVAAHMKEKKPKTQEKKPKKWSRQMLFQKDEDTTSIIEDLVGDLTHYDGSTESKLMLPTISSNAGYSNMYQNCMGRLQGRPLLISPEMALKRFRKKEQKYQGKKANVKALSSFYNNIPQTCTTANTASSGGRTTFSLEECELENLLLQDQVKEASLEGFKERNLTNIQQNKMIREQLALMQNKARKSKKCKECDFCSSHLCL